MMLKRLIHFVFLLLTVNAIAQTANKNFAVIQPGDSEAEIVYKAAHIVPSPQQLRWQQLELTAFFHFGINTFTGREWGDGKEDPQLFNPSELDARQWVRTAKEAGIRQVIITAKHHDGFCLWPTSTTDHSVKSSPWKNGTGDVVKEVADACRLYQVGFGIYLSPWDRNTPLYGTEQYNDFFVNQLTELLTNYGMVNEVWFDGANGEGPNGKKQVYDFERYYKVIRQLQPNAVIAIMGPDVRWVGTETGYGREQEWSVVPAGNLNQAAIAQNSQQGLVFKPQGDMRGDDLGSREKIIHAKGLVWYPAETDVSIRPGWFFHPEENNKVKTPEKLLDIYFSSAGRNGVLLLNIPPDKRGLLHDSDVTHLHQWKQLLDETFATNLAAHARVISTNGLGLKALLDHNFKTYWTTKGSDSSAIIELDLKEEKSFDVLMLQENIAIGQRVEKFIASYWNGKQWIHFTEGTTIGYKRLLRFAPVTSHKIRLEILSSRSNPTLSEIGLYKLAAQ